MSEEPRKLNLRLPPDLYTELQVEAEEAQASLNSYILSVLEARRAFPEQPVECDHEPYLSTRWFRICYRCGTPL